LYDKPDDATFKRLEHLLSLANIKNRTIKSLYYNCGFNSWNDFYDAKKGRCTPEELIMVDCVEDKLKGALSSLKFVFKDKLRKVA